MLPFSRVTIIGLGLIGSSLCRAIRDHMPTVRVTGYDADPQVRQIARAIDLADDVTDTAGTGFIQLNTTTIVTGGPIQLSSVSLRTGKITVA